MRTVIRIKINNEIYTVQRIDIDFDNEKSEIVYAEEPKGQKHLRPVSSKCKVVEVASTNLTLPVIAEVLRRVIGVK